MRLQSVVRALCASILSLFMTSCGQGKPGAFSGNGYHVGGGVVWYLQNWTSEPFVVAGADAKTFQFPLPKADNASYAKDAKQVYLFGKIILGADPATFEFIRGRFSRDAKYVYSGDKVFCDDPANFQEISINFAKNGHSVYQIESLGKEVVSRDVANFRLISSEDWHSYCADSTQVFVNGNLLPGAKPERFKVLGGAYATDGTQTFYFDKPMPPGTDMATLQALAGGYAKDRDRAYYLGRVLEGADAASFEITDPKWPKAKDKNQRYEQGNILPKEDGKP